jgi:class 3 adenylate cyclase
MCATPAVVHELNDRMTDELSDHRRVTDWDLDRSFIYLDVSDFSRLPHGEQALVINSIVSVANLATNWISRYVDETHEAMLCIGDGYIFVFDDAVVATFYAAVLADMIEGYIAHGAIVEFHFRMGVHVGRVNCFWDPGRNDWNYVGDGINDGSRILSAIGKQQDDVVFVSSDVRREIRAGDIKERPAVQILKNIANRGRREDKHGTMRRVYELDHTAIHHAIHQGSPPYKVESGPYAIEH